MSVKLLPIDHQVIVVTGASSGIGLATALEAASRGARVILAARSSRTLTEVVERIRADGGEAAAVVADVSDRGQVQRIADEAVRLHGRIDSWINNAGVSLFGRLEEVTDADHRRLFDINFWGVVYGSLVALPHLRQRGGALINLGSDASEIVVPLQGMYSASKHAIIGFTDALRVEVCEVEKAPVSITLVQPTAVDTPIAQHARNYMEREPKLPLKHLTPEGVAERILEAAEKPIRTVKIGGARLDSLAQKVAPALAEKLTALVANRQQYDEPPRRPEGTLHYPGESGRTRGTGGRH